MIKKVIVPCTSHELELCVTLAAGTHRVGELGHTGVHAGAPLQVGIV